MDCLWLARSLSHYCPTYSSTFLSVFTCFTCKHFSRISDLPTVCEIGPATAGTLRQHASTISCLSKARFGGSFGDGGASRPAEPDCHGSFVCRTDLALRLTSVSRCSAAFGPLQPNRGVGGCA